MYWIIKGNNLIQTIVIGRIFINEEYPKEKDGAVGFYQGG